MKQNNIVRNYTDENIDKLLNNDQQRNAFQNNRMLMKANYENNVDFQLLKNQVWLCETVKDVFYNKRSSSVISYEKGTRPELEKIVKQLISSCYDERDKVLTIMRFCRDLYKNKQGSILFYGGTEEELIKKGEQLCECLSRLMTALCEIIDIPARIITHTIGGHLTCEVYFNNKWAYIDPRKGLYFLKPDDTFASTWDLWKDTTLFYKQSDHVKSEISDRFNYSSTIESLVNRFFHPNEIITIKNYSLSDAGLYNYNWTTNYDLDNNGLNAIADKYMRARSNTFSLPEEKINYGFDFSISHGQKVNSKTKIFVYPRGYKVAPNYVDFFIDNIKIWTSKPIIPVRSIHKDIRNLYILSKEEQSYDFSSLDVGLHTLRAESKGLCDDRISSEVVFEVENSL